MDKQTILAQLTQALAQSVVTRADVMGVLNEARTQEVTKKRLNVSQIFYGIGSAIVLIGILILLIQNWTQIGTVARILVSFGSGVIAFVVGYMLQSNDDLKKVSLLAYVSSLILIPIGVSVTLFEMDFVFGSILLGTAISVYVMAVLLRLTHQSLRDIAHVGFIASAAILPAGILFWLTDTMNVSLTNIQIQVLVSAILLAFFTINFFVYKRIALFLALIIAYATWLYFSVVGLIVDAGMLQNTDIYLYAAAVAGIVYVLLGNITADGNKLGYEQLSRPLHFLGIVGVLGTTLALGGIWDVLYVGVLFVAVWLSISMHNSLFLRISSLFLMGYIIKISSQYFSDSLGWPFALVIMGILLVVIGYLTVYLNKKYIVSNSVQQ